MTKMEDKEKKEYIDKFIKYLQVPLAISPEVNQFREAVLLDFLEYFGEKVEMPFLSKLGLSHLRNEYLKKFEIKKD